MSRKQCLGHAQPGQHGQRPRASHQAAFDRQAASRHSNLEFGSAAIGGATRNEPGEGRFVSGGVADARARGSRELARHSLVAQKSNGHAVAPERLEQRPLFSFDPIQIAEPFGVLEIDQGQERYVGLHDASELGHLAALVGAEFEDGQPMLRAEAEHGHRHTDSIVQVTGRGEHGSRRRGRQQTRHYVLGGRLAGGAADGDDAPGPAAPMKSSQITQGPERVLDEDDAGALPRDARKCVGAGRRQALDQEHVRAGLGHLLRELVTIEAFADQGHEQLASSARSAVRGDAGGLRGALTHQSSTGGLEHFGQPKRGAIFRNGRSHQSPLPTRSLRRSAKANLTRTRSSNSKRSPRTSWYVS